MTNYEELYNSGQLDLIINKTAKLIETGHFNSIEDLSAGVWRSITLWKTGKFADSGVLCGKLLVEIKQSFNQNNNQVKLLKASIYRVLGNLNHKTQELYYISTIQ